MVRLDKLTQRSQDALQYAQELAESNNNSQIEVEHLLLALLEQGQACPPFDKLTVVSKAEPQDCLTKRIVCVILFDEIEKTHAEVFNILLQVLDDGRLTDNQGRTISFKNAILIMTSNIGASLIAEMSKRITIQNEEEIYQEMRSEVLNLLRRTLRPEFLNRIDEIIVFHSLSFEEIKKIVDLQFEEVNQRLTEQEMTASLTEKAKEHLAKIGFDSSFRARPLKRMIQKLVSQPLANEILKGKFRPKDKIEIDVKGDKIVFV